MIRLFVLNVAFACFVIWAAWLGYIGMVFAGDASKVSYGIAVVFVATIFRTMADARRGRPLSYVESVEIWLTTAGLIGNCIGFVMALRGLDASALASADGAQKIAGQLLSGLGVAFYSTLTGAVCALWLSIVRRMAG